MYWGNYSLLSEQTQKAEPTSQTSFTNQFKQVAANLKQISADPEMKKALINFLQQQPVTASAESVVEGVEEQSELILAAKDMMDKVTGYLEDLATMKTEGMLELADRIRDEMGAEKADAFMQKIQPALEQAEATLSTTRAELDNGVRILTGEEVAQEPMGSDDTIPSELITFILFRTHFNEVILAESASILLVKLLSLSNS